MNLVVPGLKDRRVFSRVGECLPRDNQAQGEVADNGCGEIGPHSVGRSVQFTSEQCTAEVDTLALQLAQGILTDPTAGGSQRDPTAHFMVSTQGDIYYTLDISQAIQSGVCSSFIIGFECDALAGTDGAAKSRLPGLSRDSIIAGRRLVAALSSSFPNLKCICCHDNLNALVDTGLLDRNTVQDLWVNIGAWAIAKLPLAGYRRACSPQKDAFDSGTSKRSEESWLLNGALLGG